MKLGIITKPNEKGQIVIPKEMRKLLGINVNDLLHLFVRGGGLFIQPISDVVPKTGNADNYLKVLERTRGAWGNAKTIGEKQKRSVELAASQARKKAW
ncbi:MAG: AbrB/MazE/SpoVT family DNA-binding domain-containing protein [bacterium]|nr:AbrB/MazE/SpoVT family DNA-binding domain-containing protein [bacterium]